jgi:hypothetical protein
VAPLYNHSLYLAMRIRDALSSHDPEGLIAKTGRVQADLHPEGGWLQSSIKTIDVIGTNGKRYVITIAEPGEVPSTQRALRDAALEMARQLFDAGFSADEISANAFIGRHVGNDDVERICDPDGWAE